LNQRQTRDYMASNHRLAEEDTFAWQGYAKKTEELAGFLVEL